MKGANLKFFLLVFLIIFSTFSTNNSHAQDAAKGKILYATCIQCHGEEGNGNVEKLAPRISGQHDWYTVKQITEIKSGVRKNAAMMPFVLKLTDQDIKDLAAYITTL
jgi:cytochrome c553